MVRRTSLDVVLADRRCFAMRLLQFGRGDSNKTDSGGSSGRKGNTDWRLATALNRLFDRILALFKRHEDSSAGGPVLLGEFSNGLAPGNARDIG